MLSGTSKISFRTVAAFFKRSISFSSLSFADAIEDHETKIRASAAAKSFDNRFLFINSSFEIEHDQEMKGFAMPCGARTPVSPRHPPMTEPQNRWNRYRVVLFFGGLN